ncbi:MAG: hypoxanthine phosphoribosyltransferase [Eubacteriales bacterium]|nr:hypoxanthine phosphoribosyltransferase [Eubacteriales bacterium]
MENQRTLYNDLESILYTKEQLKEAVQQLGERITRDYKGRKPVMVCILKGASLFFSDLIREIDLPLTIDFMVVSSYGASTVSSGEVRLIKDLDRSILGKDVIVVEDIVDTGMTLNYLKKLLISRGASSLRIAALLDKPARRTVPLSVDYTCFEIPDAFVVGYGLDYDEVYRNLPEVGILSPSVYQAKTE